MNVLWCITGAGQYLVESCEFMRGLSRKPESGGKGEGNSKKDEENSITVVFSRAGYEVAQMYGLLEMIRENFPEIILEDDQGASAPMVGRLAKKEYERVVVAPCTANTTAKIACGIADSLVTNIVAQAGKCKIPVIILPTDAKKVQKTKIPINIDPKRCINCKPCPAMENCPQDAFFVSERVRVNLLRCNACRKCIGFCRYGAIGFGEGIIIKCRDIDVENVKKMGEIKGIYVIEDVYGLRQLLKT